MRDQIRRNQIEIGCVFDDTAQALGGGRRRGEAEGRGVALDVMGGAKQLFAVFIGEAVAENGGVGCREPVGFDRHPVLELPG